MGARGTFMYLIFYFERRRGEFFKFLQEWDVFERYEREREKIFFPFLFKFRSITNGLAEMYPGGSDCQPASQPVKS